MTKEQFREWFQHHVAAFPSCRSWLKKYPKDRDANAPVSFGAEPTQREIVAEWFRTLEKVNYEDAIRATDQLAQSDEDFSFSYERAAAKVRSIATGFGRVRKFCEPKRFDPNTPTFKCHYCQDSGKVPVVCPCCVDVMGEAWPEGPPDHWNAQPICAEPAKRIHIGRYSADCFCAIGIRFHHNIRFDPETVCYFTGHNWQSVRDWFAARAVRIAESRKFKEWV